MKSTVQQRKRKYSDDRRTGTEYLLPARVGKEISPISGSPVLRIAQVYISDVQMDIPRNVNAGAGSISRGSFGDSL